jgi:molybdate transport system substrate-binding protein
MDKKETLTIYSAGAVASPLMDAAEIFQHDYNVICDVQAGKPEELLEKAKMLQKGDVFSAGAEWVFDDSEELGMVIKGSRKSLGYRRSVIIIPLGNPAKITSLKDLCRKDVKIGIAIDGCLKGVWDDIASKARLTDQIRKNITRHADACGSLMGLIHSGKVDAIFGWNAFQGIWPNTCEAIELPVNLQVLRSTAVGILSYTKNKELSAKFIDYLTSPMIRKIYEGYGWIHNAK